VKQKKQDKPVVLITGAASGIGKATCEIFFDAGYRVIGVDLHGADDLPYEMIGFDISHLSYPNEEVESFYRRIAGISNGRLDALINNAAVQVVKPIKDIKPVDWSVTLETNLLAPFWLIQHFLPMLSKAKGSVVNIASIHALQTKSKFTAYATSKGALVSLTRSMAIELGPTVRVNAVVPAATDTPMLRAGFRENKEGFDSLAAYHPIGRVADAFEIAKVVFFLSGPGASAMTGAIVNVDGGIGGCLHDPVV